MNSYRRKNREATAGFGTGSFSGWRSFREGRKPTAKATRIFGPDKHKHVVARVLEQLKDWRGSPFQHEGACRAGLRSALCAAGHSWHLADREASIVLAEALLLMGAERPTWEEAQGHYTVSTDFCSWCRSPMPEDDLVRGSRFCAVVCASSAISRRSYETWASNDKIGKSAYNLIAKSRSHPRSCKFCSKEFRSRYEKTEFCSNSCAGSFQAGDSFLAEADCAWCGDPFKPESRGQRFCCHSCQGYSRHAEHRAQMADVRRACACCKTEFIPSEERNIYCSRRCAGFEANKAHRQRNRKLHMLACQLCGDNFESKMPWAKFCSREHKRASEAVARKAKDNVIYLTAEHFDRAFAIQKSVSDEDALKVIIDRLFA